MKTRKYKNREQAQNRSRPPLSSFDSPLSTLLVARPAHPFRFLFATSGLRCLLRSVPDLLLGVCRLPAGFSPHAALRHTPPIRQMRNLLRPVVKPECRLKSPGSFGGRLSGYVNRSQEGPATGQLATNWKFVATAVEQVGKPVLRDGRVCLAVFAP